jgi:KTSC domain-containing protein
MKLIVASLVLSISLGGACQAACDLAPDVKYRDGPVNLATFDCKSVDRSSFIECVCYDRPHAYMLVKLRGTYYHYCDIDSVTVNAFEAAPSMGHFYNASIKGHFDCRTGHVPP